MDYEGAVGYAKAAGPDIWARVLVCAGLRREASVAEAASAIRRFDAVRQAFVASAERELWSAGRRPNPEFRRLAGLPATRPGPRAQDAVPLHPAPPHAEPWLGLDKELRNLTDGRHCIVGPPGVGKTRALAWHLARAGSGRGVVWLDARMADPVWGWSAWFPALLPPLETSAPDRARRVRRHCEEAGLLVVLDGVDAHDAELWMRHLPKCPILATSRSPLEGFATLPLELPAMENLAVRAVLDNDELRAAAGARASRLERSTGRAHAQALTLAADVLLAGPDAASLHFWAWSGIEARPLPDSLAEFLEARTPADVVLEQLEATLADEPGALPYTVQWKVLEAGSRFLHLPEPTRVAWLRLGIDYALSDMQAEHPAGALRTLRLLAASPGGTAPEDTLVRYHTGRALLTLARYEEALAELGAAAMQVADMPPTDGRASLISRALVLRARCLEMLGAPDEAARERQAAEALSGALP